MSAINIYLHKTEMNLKFKIKQQNSDATLVPGICMAKLVVAKEGLGALCMFGGRVNVQVGRF